MTSSTFDVAVCCSNDSVRSVGALTQFVEQPRVLDSDHRLGGKVRHQRDLLVGERTHLLAIHGERTNRRFLAASELPKRSARPLARRPQGTVSLRSM